MEYRYATIFALLGLMALANATLADAVKGQGLETAMDDVKCKNDFTIGVIDSIVTAVPDSSGTLDQYVDMLGDDQSALQSFADQADVDGFRGYVKGTYDPHLKSAREAVMGVRKGAKNVSNGSKGALVQEYKGLRTTYDACHLEALKAHAREKLDGYGKAIEAASGKADMLKEKGVDTGELEAVIDGAKSDVVDPLESAVDSATDAKGIHSALQGHCLYNGCQDGKNYHFAARFEVKKLDAVLGKLESDPSSGNASAEIASAKGSLGFAQDVLDSNGPSHYSDSQYSSMWDSIKGAAQSIKEALAAMRSG